MTTIQQRFPTGGTRTPRGTPAVAKGYARRNEKSEKTFCAKTDETSTYLLLFYSIFSYSMFIYTMIRLFIVQNNN